MGLKYTPKKVMINISTIAMIPVKAPEKRAKGSDFCAFSRILVVSNIPTSHPDEINDKIT
jgi:hypothetical protein